MLVDCLTLWLSNLMAAGRDIEAETRMLIEQLRALTGKLPRSSGNDLQPFHRVPPHLSGMRATVCAVVTANSANPPGFDRSP